MSRLADVSEAHGEKTPVPARTHHEQRQTPASLQDLGFASMTGVHTMTMAFLLPELE